MNKVNVNRSWAAERTTFPRDLRRSLMATWALFVMTPTADVVAIRA